MTGSIPATEFASGNYPSKFIAFVLLAVVLVRLCTLGAYPLGSTTEPRYAEIARKMLETGNWVTPWFDHGVPFWGKPPLSFWGSAATMALFGVNEFGARLAPFMAAVGSAALFWAWPRDARFKMALPLAASVILFSSVVGFITSAAVMTDMFMAFSTTLCMVAFWIAVNDTTARSVWRWLFFVGVALGLLAKGPVATVVTALALGLWALCTGSWLKTWQRLPWLRGTLLTAVLALPWYLLAEHRTPGFLQYFIVGEHIQRFLVSGWTGDLYGQGHAELRGLIWLFGAGGFLPWTLVTALALGLLWMSRRAQNGEGTVTLTAAPPVFRSQEWPYLVAWTVAPLVFFTAARNILEAYVLPGLPAFALLTVVLVFAAAKQSPWLSRVWLLGLVAPVLWVGWLTLSDQPEQRSQRALLRRWPENTPLVYFYVRPLSANFYSKGQAQLVDSPAEIARWMSSPKPVTLVMQDTLLPQLIGDRLTAWQVVGKHAGFTMLQHRLITLDQSNTSLPLNAPITESK